MVNVSMDRHYPSVAKSVSSWLEGIAQRAASFIELDAVKSGTLCMRDDTKWHPYSTFIAKYEKYDAGAQLFGFKTQLFQSSSQFLLLSSASQCTPHFGSSWAHPDAGTSSD